MLQNHVVAANAVFNKVAVFKELIQREPHNAMYYEEVQRVQKNQHIHVNKPKSLKKRMSELGKPSGVPPTKTSKTVTKTKAKPAQDEHLLEADDTLETESSSSDLPPGL